MNGEWGTGNRERGTGNGERGRKRRRRGNGERGAGNGEEEEEEEEEEGVTGNVFPEQAKNRTAIVFVTISMNGEYTYEYGKYV